MNKWNIPKTKSITRRDFIKDSMAGAGSIALGGVVFSMISGCSDSSPTGPSNGGSQPAELILDLNDAPYRSLQSVGGVASLGSNSIDAAGLLLFRESGERIRAYSRRCTHQGCTVGPFAGGRSTCPCHGSVYDTAGSVVNGPAPAPLPQYTTSLENDVLTISR